MRYSHTLTCHLDPGDLESGDPDFDFSNQLCKRVINSILMVYQWVALRRNRAKRRVTIHCTGTHRRTMFMHTETKSQGRVICEGAGR